MAQRMLFFDDADRICRHPRQDADVLWSSHPTLMLLRGFSITDQALLESSSSVLLSSGILGSQKVPMVLWNRPIPSTTPPFRRRNSFILGLWLSAGLKTDSSYIAVDK